MISGPIRSALAALLVMGACAACATAPPRRKVTKAPSPVAAADVLQGCKVVGRDAAGYGLDCGDVSATVDEGNDVHPPAVRRRQDLASIGSAVGRPDAPRRTITLVLAGKPRTVLVLDAPAERGMRAFVGMAVAFDVPGHRGVDLSCGGYRKPAAARCPALLAWLADHRRTPPKPANPKR